ncbi:MAG TPA: DUF1513 domain-containing protein [Dokdonella sp.]|uniref:DUF1513 domain-containing protein n=1 Tax=Dokdonella sp. TaxID=2291710 RepID=UPI002CACF707|nr:DUF1513 domain-containing protein [Dokdonella sp.]HUD41780.1 DUF1513 domain-containing protein [Dokdonella sp.]
MAIDRRAFLGWAAAAAASPLLAAAPATAPERFVAARRRDGRHEVAIIDAAGRDLAAYALPERGHSFAIDARRGRLVAFGRQPGYFALAFDRDGAGVRLPLPEGRHYFGHGAFSADGAVLYATENDYEAGRAVLGVYDASPGGRWRRIGEFDCAGIGAHEVVLLPDRRTLCVANGGILTHPDYGKRELNLDSMAPSLAYLDARDGRVIESVALDPALHRLSIRHLALDAAGAVWFGCQYLGAALDRPPLVGRHRRGEAPRLFAVPDPVLGGLRNYIGSVAADAAGSVIATSSPIGGRVAYWDAASGRCLGTNAIADGCGVAGAGAGRFLVSDGHGAITEAGPSRPLRALRETTAALEWDNHLRRLG